MLPDECFDASKGETRPVKKTVMKKKILKRKVSDMDSVPSDTPNRPGSAAPNLRQTKPSNSTSTPINQSSQNEVNTKRKPDQLDDVAIGGEVCPIKNLLCNALVKQDSIQSQGLRNQKAAIW